MTAAIATLRRFDWPQALIALLVVGYLSMSRTFAHLGHSPVFIGEMAFGALLIGRSRALARPMLGALAQPSAISLFAWLLFVSLTFGALECLRGLFTQQAKMVALTTVILHIYPLFFFPGLWLGVRRPDFLRSLVKGLSWVHGIYGVLYIAVFSPLGWTDGGEEVPAEFVSWCGQPYGASVAVLGLLSLEPRLGRVWAPLALNLFTLLALQVRAAWIGFAVALLLWAYLSGRVMQMIKLVGVLLVLLIAALVADVGIPSPATRGQGEVTVRTLVGRAVAAVDPDLARQFTPNAESFGDTVSWRTGWWKALWKEVITASPRNALIGPGYGYPIWEHHPLEIRENQLRTPHNIFIYCASYTGFVGVAIFYALHFALLRVQIKAYRISRQPLGLCYWTLLTVWSLFDVIFEAPFGAIPFYLMMGLCAAPLFRPSQFVEIEKLPLPSAPKLPTVLRLAKVGDA